MFVFGEIMFHRRLTWYSSECQASFCQGLLFLSQPLTSPLISTKEIKRFHLIQLRNHSLCPLP